MKRNKLFRKRKLYKDELFVSLFYTAMKASIRPRNRFKRGFLCYDVARKMITNYRKHRYMIRHDGYSSADIADMIINKEVQDGD